MLIFSLAAALCLALAAAELTAKPGYQRDPTDIVPQDVNVRVVKRWGRCSGPNSNYDCWSRSRPPTQYDRDDYEVQNTKRGNRNGRPATVGLRSIISDWIGTGWVTVPFGEQGTASNKLFNIKSARPIRIDAVDLFCTGDQFRLEATEVDGRYVYEMKTTDMAADDCRLRTSDPQQAWNDGIWSRGTMKLPSGHYSIKVFSESSPYGGGSMAIRALYQ